MYRSSSPRAVNTLNHVVIRWKDVARHDGQMDTFAAKGFAGHLIEACARIEESTILGERGRCRLSHESLSGGIESHVAAKRIRSGTVLRLAEEEHADLLLMSGYGHSRLGEWAVGGMR